MRSFPPFIDSRLALVRYIKAGPAALDTGDEPFDHGCMDAVSKEILDARLGTVDTKMDGRIATLEVRIDGKFSGVDAQFAEVNVQFSGVDVKFAELRGEVQKGFADMTKWIVGTVVGVAAVTITIMTFVLNNAVPKVHAAALSQTAPIVGPAVH